jgi:type IV pilus assembly protein PilA
MLRIGRKDRGFTLVELAIIVVIVGVLAVVAVVLYRRHLRTSHLAEATNMTKSIRAAQEAHKAETGLYSNVSKDMNSYYPAQSPGPFKTEWGAPCSTACYRPDGWKRLAVDASGPVMFGYATVAGVGASISSSSSSGGSSSGGSSSGSMNAVPGAPSDDDNGSSSGAPIGPAEPFYSTVAYGDPDGDGRPTKVLGFSQTGQLIIQGD